MSDKLDELMENEVSVDLEKREFMSKFGKYAVVSAGMATLMTANASGPHNSGSCNRKPPPTTNQCGGGKSGPKYQNGGGGRSGNPINIDSRGSRGRGSKGPTR